MIKLKTPEFKSLIFAITAVFELFRNKSYDIYHKSNTNQIILLKYNNADYQLP